jgi:hypothetical protein
MGVVYVWMQSWILKRNNYGALNFVSYRLCRGFINLVIHPNGGWWQSRQYLDG